MRYLMIIFLLATIGCTSVEIQQYSPITTGQIYVSEFTGSAGQIISNAIQIELHKQNFLVSQEQAKFILTGSAYFAGVSDGIAFELRDKKGNLYFRGNATTGGFLSASTAGKDVAKKIIKKIKKNPKKHLTN